MGEKFLLALLSFMLVILLVFNSFGIAYSNNNFFGTILTVEGWLADTSESALDFATNVKDVLKPVLEVGTSILETLESIDEKLEASNQIKDVGEGLKYSVTSYTYYLDFFINYSRNYGIHFLNEPWWDGMVLGWDCIQSDDFYTSNGSLNYDKIFAYIDAMVYGEENEYAYIFYQMEKMNVHNMTSGEAETTVCIMYDMFASIWSKVDFDECEYWFTTLNLKLPENYYPSVSVKERFFKYFTGVLPVFDTNMTYEYKEQTCKLTGIRFSRVVDSLTEFRDYTDLIGFFGVVNKFDKFIDLQFTYYDDVGRTRTFYIGLSNYLLEKCSHTFGNHVVDDIGSVLTRSDSVN